MALSWFKDKSLSCFNLLHNYLREWHIGELKLSFVSRLLKTHIKPVNWSAEWTNANLWAILFPGNSSDWVVVLNLLATDLIPLWSFWIEVKHVKAVEVSNNTCFSSWVEWCASEFLYFLIFWIIKSLEAVPRWFIKAYLTIISSRHNVGTPWQSVWNSGVLQFSFCFCF